jgi:hypothetical protein
MVRIPYKRGLSNSNCELPVSISLEADPILDASQYTWPFRAKIKLSLSHIEIITWRLLKPLIRNVGCIWSWLANFKHTAALPSLKKLQWNSLSRRLRRPQDRYRHANTQALVPVRIQVLGAHILISTIAHEIRVSYGSESQDFSTLGCDAL